VRERRRDYELMFIISPLAATSEENVNATVDRLRQSIESEGGTVSAVSHTSPWGKKKLAYPIREYVSGEASRRAFSEGYYVLLHFSLSAAKVANVERTIKLTDTILRHLITVIEPKRAAAPPAEGTAVAEKSEA
jgi:small subunit ribosomal protein S6